MTDETVEYITVPDEERNVFFTMRLKQTDEGVSNEIEVNCGFMSHLKRNPEDVEHFLDEFSRVFRGYVEDAE